MRLYCILCGVLGALYALAFVVSATNALQTLYGLVAAGFGIAWLYVGIRFPRLLITSSRAVISVILASMVVAGVLLVAYVVSGASGMALWHLLLILFLWYLLKNVRRLVAE